MHEIGWSAVFALGVIAAAPGVEPPPRPAATSPSALASPPEALRAPGRRLREGAFLGRRTGSLVNAPTGDTIFVPDTVNGRTDRPMALLPCQTLARIRASMAGAESGASAVELSGQIFAHRGREYMLPTLYRMLGPIAPEPTPAQTDQPATNAVASNPEVAALIKELESRRSSGAARRSEDALPSVPAQPEQNAASAVPEREGTMLTNRRGRLVRTPSGDWAISFDGDGEPAAAAPFVVLPCRILEQLEDLTIWQGDGAVLDVSGRVTTFEGRNYLLPTMYVVPAPSEFTAGQ